jgi:hypothetical protein
MEGLTMNCQVESGNTLWRCQMLAHILYPNMKPVAFVSVVHARLTIWPAARSNALQVVPLQVAGLQALLVAAATERQTLQDSRNCSPTGALIKNTRKRPRGRMLAKNKSTLC